MQTVDLDLKDIGVQNDPNIGAPPLQKDVVNLGAQTDYVPELDLDSRQERERRLRLINQQMLHKAQMEWPMERIAQNDARIVEQNTIQY